MGGNTIGLYLGKTDFGGPVDLRINASNPLGFTCGGVGHQIKATSFRERPYGYAYVPLKESFVPTRQRPFDMHGKRLEAQKSHLRLTRQ